MTLGYNNLLVRWAYLFNKGIPNETTRKDFLFRALVLVPGILIWTVTIVVLAAMFFWRHPIAALVSPFAAWVLGTVVYVFVRFEQNATTEVMGYLQEKYKVYFE